MSSTKTLLVALSATASVLLSGQPLATAEPVAPLPIPINGLQAPGLPAMQMLGPVIQQAAADPTNAASMLMAAAAAFAGDSAVPAGSRNVAAAVNQIVADPQVAHVPAAGVVPGTEAHLPAGVDPVHAVGPALEAAPEALPAPAPEAALAPQKRHSHPPQKPHPHLRQKRPFRVRSPHRHPVPKPGRRQPSARTRPSRRTSCIRRSATDV